jgi:hypothetical protein
MRMALTFFPSARGERLAFDLKQLSWQSFAASSEDNRTLGGGEDNGAIDPRTATGRARIMTGIMISETVDATQFSMWISSSRTPPSVK